MRLIKISKFGLLSNKMSCHIAAELFRVFRSRSELACLLRAIFTQKTRKLRKCVSRNHQKATMRIRYQKTNRLIRKTLNAINLTFANDRNSSESSFVDKLQRFQKSSF